jgi:hypothetical protein
MGVDVSHEVFKLAADRRGHVEKSKGGRQV